MEGAVAVVAIPRERKAGKVEDEARHVRMQVESGRPGDGREMTGRGNRGEVVKNERLPRQRRGADGRVRRFGCMVEMCQNQARPCRDEGVAKQRVKTGSDEKKGSTGAAV